MAGPTIVLYVCRHPILPAELDELRKAFGDVKVVTHSKKVPTPEWLATHAKMIGADYIIPIMPLGMIKKLAEALREEGSNIRILFPVMEKVKVLPKAPMPNGDYNPYNEVPLCRGNGLCEILRFKHFIILEDIRIVGRPLLQEGGLRK